MKKIACYFFVICLLFSLAGCRLSFSGEATTDSTFSTGGLSGTEGYTPAQEPMAAISVPAIAETVSADDGNAIFTYTHQNMLLTLPDPDVADKIIIDFLGRVDSVRSIADTTLAAAKAAYSNSVNWMPYLCSILYSPTRIDQGVLSLFGSNIVYSGTSHPERVCVSANYDLVTGDVLTLGSIMSAQASTDDFCRLTLEALSEIKTEKYLYEGYEATVRQRFNRDESKDEDWYFTQSGLCFYFAPYEIASYASGVITAEIPYSKLTGLLYDGYFPAERDMAGGIVQTGRLDTVDLENFSQIAEAIIDLNGEMVFLYTDGIVWDVQIEVGTWDATGTEFTAAYTALFSHTLSPGDAIMVQTLFSDTEPHLRLTYHSGTQVITRYLTQSGKDGSILLTEE